LEQELAPVPEPVDAVRVQLAQAGHLVAAAFAQVPAVQGAGRTVEQEAAEQLEQQQERLPTEKYLAAAQLLPQFALDLDSAVALVQEVLQAEPVLVLRRAPFH